MSLIQFNKVYKQFSGEYILRDINFTIEEKDKIGLVGLNGAGKTTLIKMILGQENLDGIQENVNEKGYIFINKNIKIGYLSQNNDFSNLENTVYEELMDVFSLQNKIFKKLINLDIEKNFEEFEKLREEYAHLGGYDIDYKIKAVIQGLELNDYKDKMIKSLSGGEKTRVSLAKLLLQEPELLILDEPTNHLDIVSIEWLEKYLKKFNKAFLLVSHDRIFLDNVCNKIFEIENKKLYKYDGNFSSFIIQKEMILKGEIKRYEKEQEKIKKIEEYVERFRAGIKSRQARGRQKILDRMERMEDPVFNPQRMKLKFEANSTTGDNVLKVKGLEKSFGNKKVLNNINFDLYKGERVGIIGKNGIGKSTLLKIIVDKIKSDSGSVEFGSRVKVGYFDQNHFDLTAENNILQEINTNYTLTEEYLRTLAGGFLFSGEDVLKKIEKLSGGERVRVAFLKLYMERANFLILDEPTNHLDIYSIEVLEDALEDFEETMLIVSHNRHFLDSVCNTIYYLDEDGLTKFKGNYEDYKESIKNIKNNVEENDINRKEDQKISYQEQKEFNKKINKLKRDILKQEEIIENISKERKQKYEEYEKVGKENDIEKLMEIQKIFDKLDEEEFLAMEKWEQMEEELKNIYN